MSSVLDKLRNRDLNNSVQSSKEDVPVRIDRQDTITREPIYREETVYRQEPEYAESIRTEPTRENVPRVFYENNPSIETPRDTSRHNHREPEREFHGTVERNTSRELDSRYRHQEVRREEFVDSRFVHHEPVQEVIVDRTRSIRSRNLPVDRVTAPTELAYSKPDKFGLQILGLNSGETVRLVKPLAIDIEPIVLQNVVDSTGKISKKLFEMMHKYGVTVLPLRECGVFESVTGVDGFKILDYKGKKYASYCGDDYPIHFRDKLFNQIIERLSCALPYGLEEEENNINSYIWKKEESRLSKITTICGKEVEVPSLCVSEIEHLHNRLKLCSCNILEVKGDFPHIIVGINLEGVDLHEGELNY